MSKEQPTILKSPSVCPLWKPLRCGWSRNARRADSNYFFDKHFIKELEETRFTKELYAKR